MFSPLSLRICCLAAMAPALSNEKTVSENNNNNNTTDTTNLDPASQLVTFPEGREQRKRGRPRRKTELTEQCLLSLGAVAKTGVSLKSVLTDSNSKVEAPKPGDLYKERICQDRGQGETKSIESAKIMNTSEGSIDNKTGKREHIKTAQNNTRSSKGPATAKSLGVVKNSRSASKGFPVHATTTAPADVTTNGTNALQQVKPKVPVEIQSPRTAEQDGGSVAKTVKEIKPVKSEPEVTVPSKDIEIPKVVEQVDATLKPAVCVAKKSKEILEVESSTRQKDLETKAECLYKRLRRLQSRQGISHARGQLSGIVDHQRRHPQSLGRNSSSIDIKEAKDLSTSALVNLVQVWQSSAKKLHGSSKTTNNSGQQGGVRLLDETVCGELNKVAGHLTTNLHHLQRSLDSDATESSSGGESGDEAADYDYDWGEVTKPAINKRAGWRWARERAQIASRWTWLQAQVSDLEYRIRQQNEIYKQIRHSKGDVELAEMASPVSVETILRTLGGSLPKEVEEKLVELQQRNEASPANISSLLSNLEKQSASLARYLGNVFSPPESSYPVMHFRNNSGSSGLKNNKSGTTSATVPSREDALNTDCAINTTPPGNSDSTGAISTTTTLPVGSVGTSSLNRINVTATTALPGVSGGPSDSNASSTHPTTTTTASPERSVSSAGLNSNSTGITTTPPGTLLKGSGNTNVNSMPNGLLNTSGHSSCSTLTASTPGSTKSATSSSEKPPADLLSSPNDLLTLQPSANITAPLLQIDTDYQAARCRPLQTQVYRKRKLLRTSGLHLHSRKAARFSDIRCQCYPPVTPCAICGGRYNYVQGVESERAASHVPERIALLDHSYHQVLSFEEDVPLSIHFEGMMKTGAWQRHDNSRSSRTFHLEKRKGQYQIKEKKSVSKRVPLKSASAAVLSRIKNKYEVTRALSSLPQSPDKKRLSVDLRLKKKKAALNAIDGCRKERGRLGNRSQSDSSLHHRDTPSPNSSHGRESREYREVMRRKQTESAYDINNIVIPYSIAASTRVEKLQYKEIITPRWREVTISKPEVENENPVESSEKAVQEVSVKSSEPESVDMTKAKSVMPENIDKEASPAGEKNDESKAEPTSTNSTEETAELEDMSDDTYAIRHHRYEIEEKKKFAVFPSNQRRRSRPSRAESESVATGTETLSPGGVGVMTPGIATGSNSNHGNSTEEMNEKTEDSVIASLGDRLVTGEGSEVTTAVSSVAATTLPSTPNDVRRPAVTDELQTEQFDELGSSARRSSTPLLMEGSSSNNHNISGGSRLRTSSVSSNYSSNLSRSAGNGGSGKNNGTSSYRFRSLSQSEGPGPSSSGLSHPQHHHGDHDASANMVYSSESRWRERQFPLSEEDYNALFEEKPLDKYSLRNSHLGRSVHIEKHALGSTSSSGRLGYYFDEDEEDEEEMVAYRRPSASQLRRPRNVPSPSGSSTSTVTDEGDEDRNDPEWTVHKVSSRKAGLVLKIAKR